MQINWTFCKSGRWELGGKCSEHAVKEAVKAVQSSETGDNER